MIKSGSKSVAVIGAGACGICAAKTMLESGFSVTVFEAGSQIGGMWCYENDNGLSSAYKTLHINTSRKVTRFSDLDFDDGTQHFPDHRDMHRYLVKYADHFGVTPHIRFNTPVQKLEPLSASAVAPPDTAGRDRVAGSTSSAQPRWQITTNNGTYAFDTVIVASGHLHVPRHIEAFQQNFTGQYLHAHHYREPAPYVGKRICIVGVGNSACDISGDVCATASRCVLVARSGVLILPKLIFGVPFTDLSSRLQRPWIPYVLRRAVIRWMTWLVHGRMDKLGFVKPDKRVHTTSNGTLVTDIAYRRIEVKQGIDSIDGKRIRFVDGTEDVFDVLIGATGYLTELPFLDAAIVPVDNNQLDLYQRMVPPDHRGLYLLGFFNTDTALNFIFEHQAAWVCDIESGDACLPDAAAMKQSIEARRAWVKQHYRNTPRHHLEEESVPYLRELKKSLKQMRKRKREQHCH